MLACIPKHSFEALPLLLRSNLASGSVLFSCVSLLRFCPLKSLQPLLTSTFYPRLSDGSS